MAYDFLYSWADLAVESSTEITVSTTPGHEYECVMVFADRNPAYVIDESAFFDVKTADGQTVLGSIATITKSNYNLVTGGRLLTWLTDLFCTGMPHECYVVLFGPDGGYEEAADFDVDAVSALSAIYNKVAQKAYHKSILVQDKSTLEYIVPAAVALATSCKQTPLFSSAPYLPSLATTAGDIGTDAMYQALKPAGLDARLVYHADDERNGSIFQLGLALSGLNASGTSVGEDMEGTATNLITPSGMPDPDTQGFVVSAWESYNLTPSQQSALEAADIGFFRTVGNQTGYVAMVGTTTINHTVIQAQWILAYINYVNKVKIAEVITRRKKFKNAQTYNTINLLAMGSVYKFGPDGSGNLSNIKSNAPKFDFFFGAGRQIVINNLWSADYVFGVNTVRLTGSLNIQF
jgi:hypothetical protein